ncbi:acetolactate synthase small subunit [Mesobacillus subterraneus]|uniref:acetolactate synthase small subunit n=1 Tax=Mesobacillus subterraneus TaxID=285983 RepID=UPI00203C33A6|nr:acetolactate synthase small subunit [Mesobacillus subterraneus]MCM3575963.1 acetolactate synthase small subunit [Mesobacillus subterraneus]
MKKRMVTTLVHNQNGILSRLMGLFHKHQYRIESLAVAVAYPELKDVSKMSVILEVEDDHKFLQLVKQVNKQVDVLFVTDVTDAQVIERELNMVKKLLV